jgi:hypothetical protein
MISLPGDRSVEQSIKEIVFHGLKGHTNIARGVSPGQATKTFHLMARPERERRHNSRSHNPLYLTLFQWENIRHD